MLRSTRLLVSLLPSDVLSEVFGFVQILEKTPLHAVTLGWVTVTHVCQRWRQVALDDPSLWSKLEGSRFHSTWFTEILARSRHSILDVKIECTPTKDVVSTLHTHLARIRTLQLTRLDTPEVTEALQALLSTEAPLLEHLVLSAGTDVSGGPPDRPSPVHFSSGLCLFNGQAPELRKITLHGVRISWSALPKRCPLTHLDVIQPDQTHTSAASFGRMKELMDMLAGLPTLEVLCLANCFPATPSKSTRTQPVELRNLDQLALIGPSHHVAQVFESLKLPQTARLRLNPYAETADGTRSWQKLLRLVGDFYGKPGSTIFRSLMLEVISNQPTVLLRACGAVPRARLDPYMHLGDIDLFLALSSDVRDPSRINLPTMTQQVCGPLRLKDLEYLSVVAQGTLTPATAPDWAKLFSGCTKLTTIELTGPGSVGLFTVITPPLFALPEWDAVFKAMGAKRSAIPAKDRRIPFPKLTSLLLNGLHFESRQGVPEADRPFNHIRQVMKCRKDCRVPLPVVSINDCRIAEETMDELAFLCGDTEFHWDQGEGIATLSEVGGSEDEEEW
ncbi:hypothetical protein BC834DRAFT_891547 [Gloeopeniophorella convolvens]|nr:hypothetical protein BC834DRAFT_891547 [Gloeopeniophorella convolvens]